MPPLFATQFRRVASQQKGKSAIENGFPFAEISTIAEMESWRKEVYRPMYHLHKWWAQRLGSVFRSIILASALPENAPILDLFYRINDLTGLVVFDPFMGSGTTIGEAVKLGCTAIGRDINPVAYNAVRAAFSIVTSEDAQRTFKNLEQGVGGRIRALYRLSDGCENLYYFWVKQIPCPDCGTPVDLFNNYLFARHAYPSRNPNSQCVCPACGDIFLSLYDSTEATCPACSYKFNPQVGPAGRTKAICSHCGDEFSIVQAAKATGSPPAHRLYAKIVLHPGGEKEYRRIIDEDLAAYALTQALLVDQDPVIDKVLIEPGHNTNQAINYCYTRWEQFFNARQLLALSWLGRAIKNIKDPELRLVFTVLFSGTLEFNNMFCSFKGEGTGAVRHMFAHHILKPERQPLEANVWGTPKSSGSFSTLFKSRILRALEYRKAPFEVAVTRKGKKVFGEKRYDCNLPIPENLHHANKADDIHPRSVYLSCGDSSETDLRTKSVDLVVTDPPFFDNVHYSELADFFYAWQRPLLGGSSNNLTTTRNPKEVQDQNALKFSQKLADVFAECNRILRDNGILAFTYHHSRDEGWSSVAHAVSSAGFRFVFAQPVKAEMSVAMPKHQAKEPIDLDIILVCRKREQDDRPLIVSHAAFETATDQARQQMEQFWKNGRKLSRNDIQIIILSHLIVALSAGRTGAELLSEFEECSTHVKPEIQKFYAIQDGRIRLTKRSSSSGSGKEFKKSRGELLLFRE